MGSKILLADDSITIQKVVNLTFADEGIEVIAVSNGDMAERRLAEVNPDLVLADIFMPGKNGYELCEVIKQTPQFHDVPVILLVGAFEPFNEAEARRVKADAHLTKPFESRVLVETVKHLIETSPRPKNQGTATQVMGSMSAPETPLPAPRTFPMPAIDLSAMSAPFSQPESVLADRVPTGNLADPTPFADSFPSNFDFQKPPADTTAEPVDLLSGFNAFASAPPPVQEPEPVAAINDFDSGNVFDIDAFSQSLPEEAPPLSTAAADLPLDLSAGFDQAAATTSQDILLRDSTETPVAKNAVAELAFDNLGSPEAAVTASTFEPEVGHVPDTTAMGEVGRKFDTSELAPRTPAAAQPAEPVHQALNGAAHHLFDSGVEGNQRTAEPGTTSLLSADEPLGDLLFNDFPQANYQSSANDSAPLEFGEPPAAPVQAPAETTAPADFLVTEKAPTSAKETSELNDEEAANLEVEPDASANLSVTLNPPQTEITFSTAAPVVPLSGATVPPSAEASDPATHAFEVVMPNKVEPLSVDTQLPPPDIFDFQTPTQPAAQEYEDDSVAAHTDELASAAGSETAAASPFEEVEQTEVQPTTAEDKFTASEMWAAETQFTPISVAPLPVADFSAAPLSEPSTNHVADEQMQAGNQSVDQSTSSAAFAPDMGQNLTSQHEEQSPQEVEMNQQMIDEIVRRVVAQLSESVVREIAWEVVPDCVERVVSNLTREDLSKRL